ncbi:catechol 2,3-dioxygenase-like lactoylglutathione lyase family enzyme [Bradyrhizobium sp. i1.4.4]
MFFLELAEERPLSAATDIAPIDGLDHVVVTTEDSDRAAALYGARLGLDLALDRSHQDWGQLMFFRCGDLIVEVVRRPVAGGDSLHDRLWGLSWRVADIDATRARLIAAGLDVTEVRNGRKPGTRIMTVRNGTCGIQTGAAGAFAEAGGVRGRTLPASLCGCDEDSRRVGKAERAHVFAQLMRRRGHGANAPLPTLRSCVRGTRSFSNARPRVTRVMTAPSEQPVWRRQSEL